MKVYQDEKDPNRILLGWTQFDDERIICVPYFYSELDKKWIRAGLGTALYYYSIKRLKGFECLGKVGEHWRFHYNGHIDSSYLEKIKPYIKQTRRDRIKSIKAYIRKVDKFFAGLINSEPGTAHILSKKPPKKRK